jgi:hypothetical protein
MIWVHSGVCLMPGSSGGRAGGTPTRGRENFEARRALS